MKKHSSFGSSRVSQQQADDIWPRGAPPPDGEQFIDKVAELLAVSKDAIVAKQSIINTNGNGNMVFPDLPEEALDGRLGEICREKMGAFPRAYAWPALLAAASTLIEERTTRTNLYCALVGPVGSGKSQAIEWALKILGVEAPALMDIMSGSGEQLIRRTKDAQGAARLFSPDELSHLFEKMNIENSSFGSILNRAYYHDKFENLFGKKESSTFDCVLSIVGGIVFEKFDKLFNSFSTGGFYDRFIFGYVERFVYEYRPFDAGRTPVKANRVVVEYDVWQMKNNWIKINKEWDTRIAEHAIRCAVICAACDGRTALRAEDLGPAYEMIRYQHLVRDFLKPNPGENYEGRLAHKFLNYLKRYGGLFVDKRELLRNTRAYDLGPSAADRALTILKANGDIEMQKSGKKIIIKLVTEQEHAVGAGPEEEL